MGSAIFPGGKAPSNPRARSSSASAKEVVLSYSQSPGARTGSSAANTAFVDGQPIAGGQSKKTGWRC